jgi:hypothetical protein
MKVTKGSSSPIDREKELVRLLVKLRSRLWNDFHFGEEERELVREIDAAVSVLDPIAGPP